MGSQENVRLKFAIDRIGVVLNETSIIFEDTLSRDAWNQFYKGKPVKVKQVSEDLGVQYVLEGSFQRFSNRVRVTAQLIDALAGHHVWAERYDRDVKDIFALQDEFTRKVLIATHVKLTQGGEVSSWEKWAGKYYRGASS